MSTVGVSVPVAASPSLRMPVLASARVWRAVLSAALVAAAWALLAPPALGGRTSYVVTTGISMLPRYHADDLVVLRKEPSYHVGEVAGYHNGQLHVVVMHRIIAIRDGHYYFKGDNNNFVDSFQPAKAGIVGAEWVHLPGAGSYLLRLRNPAVTGIGLGIIWLLSFSPRRTRRQRRRHRLAR